MMFTLVAIQNMLLDYSIANEEITSWGIQLKWQKIDFTEGTYSLDELLNNLALAEHEDVQEETDQIPAGKVGQRELWKVLLRISLREIS